jgi:hypothetical protein
LYGSDKFNELPDDTPLVFEPNQEIDCRLALLKPAGRDLPEVISVATSYPRALAGFALRNCLNIERILLVGGKVEGYVASGMTDAAFDIVSSGETARRNGLELCPMSGEPVELGGLWLESQDTAPEGDLRIR